MGPKPVITLIKRLERNNAEIKFKPKLKSWENVVAAAKELEDKYPTWQLNKGQQGDIVLVSSEDKKTVRTKFDSIYYSNENAGNSSNELISQFKILFPYLITEPKVEEVRHVGFRKVIAFETDINYSELVEIHFERFYNLNCLIDKNSTTKIIDTTFAIDSEANGIKNRIRISPMIKEEVIAGFNSIFEVDKEELKTDAYLFFDIDTFLPDGEVSPDEALGSLEKVIEENARLVKGYQDYVSNSESVG